jgi:hypothetical protein
MNVWLRFHGGSRHGETLAFALAAGHSISIGSAEDNVVMLAPPVESHHAVIRNENGALLIQALSRTRQGGIQRNQQKIERVPVLSGDQFELLRGGPVVEVLFTIDLPDPVAPATRAVPPPAAAAPVAMTAPHAAFAFEGTLPAMPAYLPPPTPPPPARGGQATAPVRAAAAAPVAACPVCGGGLGQDSFICYQCRRTMCTSHYDLRAGVCGQCAGAAGATAPHRAAFTPQMTVPAVPSMAPQLTAPIVPAIARTQELPLAADPSRTAQMGKKKRT